MEKTDNGGLSGMFGKVNHWRHIAMDLSMFGMAVAAFAASGGVSGVLDPVLGWAKMHVSGIPDLLVHGPDFLGEIFAQASTGEGQWFVDSDIELHAMHHDHLGHHHM